MGVSSVWRWATVRVDSMRSSCAFFERRCAWDVRWRVCWYVDVCECERRGGCTVAVGREKVQTLLGICVPGLSSEGVIVDRVRDGRRASDTNFGVVPHSEVRRCEIPTGHLLCVHQCQRLVLLKSAPRPHCSPSWTTLWIRTRTTQTTPCLLRFRRSGTRGSSIAGRSGG